MIDCYSRGRGQRNHDHRAWRHHGHRDAVPVAESQRLHRQRSDVSADQGLQVRVSRHIGRAQVLSEGIAVHTSFVSITKTAIDLKTIVLFLGQSRRQMGT